MAATATARRVTFLILLAIVALQLILIGALTASWALADTDLPTIGDCTGIDLSTTFDANHDGVIDCGSDIELGA